MRVLTLSATLLTSAVLACGGNGDSKDNGSDDSEPTAAATATRQATSAPTTAASSGTPTASQAQDILKRAVPSTTDLPRGFTATETTFTTNAQAAQNQLLTTPAEAAANYEKFKRIMGYSAAYSNNAPLTQANINAGVIVFLSYEVTLYADEAGTKAGFRYGLDTLDQAKQASAQGLASTQGFSNVKIVDGIGGNFGDESTTFRLTATAATSGQTYTATYDVVIFRRGKLIGLQLTGGYGTPSANSVANLARQFVTKVENAQK